MTGWHLRRRLEIQIAFGSKFLNQTVQQLAQFFLRFLGAVAAQRLQQLGGELTALDQRIENRLTQSLDGSIRFRVEIVEVRIKALSAGKPRLQQKIGELVQQRLEINCISGFRTELRVRVEAHDSNIQPGHGACIIPAE